MAAEIPWEDAPPFDYDPPEWVYEEPPHDLDPPEWLDSAPNEVVPPPDSNRELQYTGILIEPQNEGFKVGVVEIWQDMDSGETTGAYLHMADAPHLERAEEMEANIYRQADEQNIPETEFGEFAHGLIKGRGEWQDLTLNQWIQLNPAQDTPNLEDGQQWSERDRLLEEAFTFVLPDELQRSEMDEPHELNQALQQLGLELRDFDPSGTPPPLFDEETNMGYWIGVYQPTEEDRAIAAVLSISQDEAGQTTAHLAPVMIGTVEQANQTAEYLLDAAERTQDIDQVLELAEGMAVATQQREGWETEQGISLDLER